MKRLKSIQAVVAVAVLLFLAVPATQAQQHHNPANTATAGFAAEKYISKEFGFSISFPSAVVSVSKDRNMTFFDSWNADKTWWGNVNILDYVPYETGPVNKEFMNYWFNALFSDAWTRTSASSYSTLQGYPTVSAEVTKRRHNDGKVMTGRIIYVFVKERRRIYAVYVWSFPGPQEQAQEPFIKSFEIQ
jgi:hypothetical protein